MKTKLLTFFLFSAIGCIAWGETTYEQDNLVYTLYEDHAEVTGHSETLPPVIEMPSMITYDNVSYPVTAIAARVFFKSEIEDIYFPASLTSIGEFAFASTELKTLKFPASVKEIGICAFRGCTGLKTIEIPSTVTHIGGGAFTYCVPVTVSPDNPYYKVVDGVLFNKDMTTILSYPMSGPSSYVIPSTVTHIDDWTFFNAYLKEITIPSSVITIGNSVFLWNSFTDVKIPSSVTSIGAFAFEFCGSLQSIEIPSSVTNIGNGAFQYCKSIVKASVPSSVTSMGSSVFEGCELMEEIDFNADITTIEYGLFRECKSLKAITIPPTVTSLGKSSFLECESLTSVVVPPSVTVINDYVFSKCTSLETLELSPNLTKIRSYAFEKCESLADVIYMTTNPIYCDKNIFSDYTYEHATLTLAAGGMDEVAYKVPWKYFLDIQEDIESGVGFVSPDEKVETVVFSIDGRYVSDSTDNLNPGVYVVRRNDTTHKIIVK